MFVISDSLNMKNFVVLLACVSPNLDDVSETLATLRFAEKTKVLKSRPQLESLATEFEVKILSVKLLCEKYIYIIMHYFKTTIIK